MTSGEIPLSGKEGDKISMNRIAKLISVKSIMTLTLTAGFVGMTYSGKITGDQFLTIYTMIVGFYFGTQIHRSDSSE